MKADLVKFEARSFEEMWRQKVDIFVSYYYANIVIIITYCDRVESLHIKAARSFMIWEMYLEKKLYIHILYIEAPTVLYIMWVPSYLILPSYY